MSYGRHIDAEYSMARRAIIPPAPKAWSWTAARHGFGDMKDREHVQAAAGVLASLPDRRVNP
jgi:hypothetical protein